MNVNVKEQLISIFGERVAFHDVERMLYSRDVGTIPGILFKFIKTKPDAIVQPETLEELRQLLRICKENKIPLIPRGAGTSSYGGTIPTAKGIVVDFCRMNKIIEINPTKETARVEPGVIWSQLEGELNDQGLALRLYPSSALSSTVGGWIANGGGIGIGSFKFGTLKDNLIEVAILTRDGIKRLSGSELDLVFGLAGTTGLIVEATLAVRRKEEEHIVLAAFSSSKEFQQTLMEIRKKNLDIWHIEFKNPKDIDLTREAIKEMKSYLSFFSKKISLMEYPENRFIAIFICLGNVNEVKEILKANKGELLSEEIAKKEWNERFHSIRYKILGPSLIASEFLIPVDNLSNLIEKINRLSNRIALKGIISNNGKQALVIAGLPANEQAFGFTIASSLSISLLEIARKLRGSPYSIGMYFTHYSKQYFGSKIPVIHKFKEEVDREHVLNPSKIFSDSRLKWLSLFIKLARFIPPKIAIHFAASKFEPKSNFNQFERDLIWSAFACTNCGYCRNVCSEFNAIQWEGSSPRGKLNFIREYFNGKLNLDERIADLFFVCTTCEQCNQICQAMLPLNEYWDLAARPMIWKKGYNPSLLFQGLVENILKYYNTAGISPEKRVEWMPLNARYSNSGEIGYWAGCLSSFNTKNIAENAIRILNLAGIEPVYLASDEWCCGAPAMLIGRIAEIMRIVEHNIKMMNERGIKKMIVSCPGCWLTLAHYYPIFAKKLNLSYDVEIEHITQTFENLIKKGKIEPRIHIDHKVTYHDPCHIGRAGGIFESPRNVLQSIPGLEFVEMKRNRENAACCGRHTIRFPSISGIITRERVREAEATGASLLVAACPSCEINFRLSARDTHSTLRIVDISDLLALSLGLRISELSELEKRIFETYDHKNRPKLEKEKERGKSLFAPHGEFYPALTAREKVEYAKRD
ncbi:MAG: FAD-binding and (Fe-S)-binding domain-containing protein [Methanocellales archaeon]